MPRQKREPKYKCQYCKRPLDNSTTKTSHELACPENPKNIKVETQETPPESQSKNLTDQIAIVPQTQSKPQRAKKTTSKKQPIRKGLEEEDELLRQYPTISKLMEDVEGLKVIPQVVEATQVQIAQLGDAVGKLNVVMAGIANRMSNPSETERGNQKRGNPVQGNNQADEALAASLAADKEKTEYTPEEKKTNPASKMEKLRKEGAESDQGGQAEAGGIDPSVAALADPNMPAGMQKIMPYIMLAERLGLLNKLKGSQPEPVQTPDDMKMIERVYANMTSVFNGALKLTQGFRVDARKEVMGEIMSTYDLTPKLPTRKEGTE